MVTFRLSKEALRFLKSDTKQSSLCTEKELTTEHIWQLIQVVGTIDKRFGEYRTELKSTTSKTKIFIPASLLRVSDIDHLDD